MKKKALFLATAALTALMATTAFAGTWIQDQSRPENENGVSNWWWQNDDGSYPAGAGVWVWIDGNGDGWAEDYCFNESGWMYANTVTPDGYTVDASGAWTDNNVVQYKQVAAQNTQQQSSSSTNSTTTENRSSAGLKNQWYDDGYGKQYLNSNGEPVIGWKKIDSKQYYFDDGGYMVTGYQELDDGNYYFLSSGALSKKTVHDTEDGYYYVVDKNDHYVIDIVYEDDWKEYKKEADRDSVDVSSVTTEKHTNSSSSSSSSDSSDSSSSSSYDSYQYWYDYYNNYQTETASGSDLTDEEAYEKIIALKKDYPEGKKWTNDNYYEGTGNNGSSRRGYGCAAFAFLVQDKVFGKTGKHITTYYDLEWEDLRVGDHLRINYDTHSVIVLSVEDDYITVCEGNYNSSIHWGRKITRDRLEETFAYRETCYD